MQTSVLKFDKANPLVPTLRDAAAREVRIADAQRTKGDTSFDLDHARTAPNDASQEDFDRDNGVARYPGQNVEHIGNGSGGIRG